MSSRSDILAAVRAHRPQPPRAAPDVPLFDTESPMALAAKFVESLKQMGGKMLDESSGLIEGLAKKREDGAIMCSLVPEFTGNRVLAPDTPPADLADIDTAILRGAFAVAETGSICLTEQELLVNAIGYLPQHLVILLDPADIVQNLHHAYRRPEFRRAHYAVLQTGPSATADIEGVLIHGAQGVRSLSVLLHPRPKSEHN